MENRFNLIDEPWIPVADYGRVSLRDIFSNHDYQSLGGNPVQKIAVFKLLLAIAQAATTPADDREWKELGAHGMAEKCLAYLDKWYDRFYLYGDKPFLQMPAVLDAINKRTAKRLHIAKTPGKKRDAELSGAPKDLGAGFYPDLPSDNNTVFSHTLVDKNLQDYEKALFVVTLMNFSFGGKRVEADLCSLSGEKLGNRHTAKAGPSIGGFWGYLHSFAMAERLLFSLWINLYTERDISSAGAWEFGLGRPAWEEMPNNETDDYANRYKNSYMATLIALSRFVLLRDDGIYYLEGLVYPSTRDGWYEPSLALDRGGKDIKVKYVDPEKRPWRELEGLLGFAISGQSTGFECHGIKLGIDRARENIPLISIWSGGLRVSSNSGDQSVKQSDDFVESNIWLESSVLGQSWFNQLKVEMEELKNLSDKLWVSVFNYFKTLKADNGKKIENTYAGKISKQAQSMFWQLCERDFQDLVGNCETTEEQRQQRQKLRRKFASYQHQSYDFYCPNRTARQIDAWAQNRPNHYKYISQEVL